MIATIIEITEIIVFNISSFLNLSQFIKEVKINEPKKITNSKTNNLKNNLCVIPSKYKSNIMFSI